MPFVSDITPPSKETEPALWFLFNNQRLLVRHEEDSYTIPQSSDLEELNLSILKQQFFGSLDDHLCYLAEVEDATLISDAFEFIGLRELFFSFDEERIRAAGVANQLMQWNQNHRFCGKCGSVTENKTHERAKICPECGLINYPRLSPAMIVAVRKEDQLLLAHSKRFPAKFHSVLAGFVEPGETLEQCVKREVMEEVGITVKNIHYFGSQPWPFPDSLMVAFTAEYAGGEIQIDGSEIAEAGWFSADLLPSIPPGISIARQLIDSFCSDVRP
jgi:NAD+ diphosphatase